MPFDNPRELPIPPAVQILRGACEVLHHRDRWCKRAYTRERHRMSGGVIWQRCAVAAIEHAAQLVDGKEHVPEVYRVLADEIELSRSMKFTLGVTLIFWPQWRINRQKVVWFNDKRKTQYRDVITLFQRGIDRLESAWTVDTERWLMGVGGRRD